MRFDLQPWGRMLTAWARQNGSGKSTLIGSGSIASAAVAGMVNGTAAHGYELDDTHDKSMSHPGTVVISAAIAVGDELGASGEDIMIAIVAGYEAMARVGMAANPLNVIEFGRHPTCLFGPFGAAAAAAHLMDMDGAGLAKAWGLTLSMASGANQFAFGGPRARWSNGCTAIPAQNGVTAAQLAQIGVGARSFRRRIRFLPCSASTQNLNFCARTRMGVRGPQHLDQAIFLLP